MKIDLDELSQLEKEMKYFGFNTYIHAYFDSANYESLVTLINSKENNTSVKFSRIPLVSGVAIMLKSSSDFISKHTNKLDTRVRYIKDEELNEIEQKSPDEIYNYLKKKHFLVDITDIPIYTCDTKAATYFAGLFNIKDLPNSFYEKLPICTTGISLNSKITFQTRLDYIHELYHILLNRNKGAVNNALNNEFLSIFIEKLAALELGSSDRLLKKEEAFRLHDLICAIKKLNNSNISYIEALKCKTYILSTLEAQDLFKTYRESQANIKFEINDEINQVLKGNKQIEDVIDKFDISPEKGFSIIKKQMKK